jgi:uncharacterized membrane protein YeaQ/YmgE (transglycosylase-associated protein family)
MNELLAFVGPMLALAGLSCGWTSAALSPARGYGLRGDMALGLVGSFVLASALYGLNWFVGNGLVVAFLIGVLGAVAAIVAQRRLWGSPAVTT